MTVAYGTLPGDFGTDLSGACAGRAVPVVELQLERAGLRLAGMLNATLR